ncbi:DUF1800 domain-containing protein [Dokdonella soli]|uniref:DUF1800 domain-containing protein n=1 Tax=Dokdonella soli TaxID=529810 RepID=A0ABN1IBY3_9GAMM
MYAWRAVLRAVLLSGVFWAGSATASVYDHIYANGFEVPADAPASDAEAARFLTQATFGPTAAEIARLRAIGYAEWINEQLGMPTTLGRPFVEQVVAARTAAGQGVDQTQRYDRWFWTATYGQDQLRERMAWALSQIFVISDQNSAISGDVIPMAEYWDLLARDAFGSYRTLLGDVTYNPTMGKFLSHFRNQKPSATTSPDENYAREVMQLFSVGLILRDIDFTPLPGNIPTYDQTVITHTAKVFTGFTYGDAPVGSGAPNYSGANFYGGAITNAGSYAPMACWGTELFPASGTGSGNMRHDITGDDGTTNTPKTVLAGLTIPANQSCSADVGAELDIIAGHANVAPFISRQLIQRFVTSNPSPAYIQRVAQVFDDNGYTERGDLGAVLKAILLDPEARTLPTDPVLLANYGKLREPLLRLTAIWRAWDAQAQPANAYGEIKMSYTTNFLNSFGQRSLSAPTVFNFYEPDYQQPGYFAGNNLYSPELQITNESTTYSTTNTLYNFIQGGYLGMTNPPVDRPLLNLAPITSLTSNSVAMVGEANRRMMYGSMSPSMQSVLTSMLQFMSTASNNEKAWSLVYVIALSPEFAAQR